MSSFTRRVAWDLVVSWYRVIYTGPEYRNNGNFHTERLNDACVQPSGTETRTCQCFMQYIKKFGKKKVCDHQSGIICDWWLQSLHKQIQPRPIVFLIFHTANDRYRKALNESKSNEVIKESESQLNRKLDKRPFFFAKKITTYNLLPSYHPNLYGDEASCFTEVAVWLHLIGVIRSICLSGHPGKISRLDEKCLKSTALSLTRLLYPYSGFFF